MIFSFVIGGLVVEKNRSIELPFRALRIQLVTPSRSKLRGNPTSLLLLFLPSLERPFFSTITTAIMVVVFVLVVAAAVFDCSSIEPFDRFHSELDPTRRKAPVRVNFSRGDVFRHTKFRSHCVRTFYLGAFLDRHVITCANNLSTTRFLLNRWSVGVFGISMRTFCDDDAPLTSSRHSLPASIIAAQ